MSSDLMRSELPTIKDRLPEAGETLEAALRGYYEERKEEPILQMSSLLERLSRQLCAESLKEPGDATFFQLIEKGAANGRLPPEIASALHYVRIFANKVRHGDARIDITTFDTRNCLRLGLRVLGWHLVEDPDGPGLSRDEVSTIWQTTQDQATDYADFVRQVDQVTDDHPVAEDVLRELVAVEEATIDDLVNELNLSRLAIIRAVTALIEHELVDWESAGSDVLRLRSEPYNLAYVIRQSLGMT